MKRALVMSGIFMGALGVLAARQARPEAAMATAATTLMATLDTAQLQKIQFAFDHDERQNWFFVPRARQGLSLKDMTEPQRKAAFALLRTGLSEKGYTKAEAIRQLEPVLKAMENGRINRDLELYFFTVFGAPGTAKWGWRYEGHHLSQNWTIVNGKATATTPAFFGANPAELMDGPNKGSRPLGAEEDLARAFMASLTDAERALAVTSPTAPADIVTLNSKRATMLEDVGIVAGSLSKEKQQALMRLIEEHAAAQTWALAADRLTKVVNDGMSKVRFAWLGSTTKGAGEKHYYRIQGPSFLIEYDNTQNNANHMHIVWRDFRGDFGVDVIGEHYADWHILK